MKITLCLAMVLCACVCLGGTNEIRRINQRCSCGGNLIATGVWKNDFPIRFEHICNGTCKATNWLQIAYPFVELVATVSGKSQTNRFFWATNNVAVATNFLPRTTIKDTP